MRRAARLAVLAVIATVALASCGPGGKDGQSDGAQRAGFPKTVSNCGHQVTIKHPPKRIFTERDTSTAVAAAGAGDRIVARSGEGDVPLGRYRDQLAKVPQVTKNSADPPPPEVVLGKGADLVVAGHVTRQDVQALEAVGVPVIVPSWFCQQVYGSTAPVNFNDTYRTLDLFGRIFDTEQTAGKTVTDLKRRVATVKKQFSGDRRRTAANLFVAQSYLDVYGRPSVNNTVLKTLGLRNVFTDANQRETSVNTETLVERNPDVLVLSYGGNDGINSREQAVRKLAHSPGLGKLAAVRQHRLLALNYGYLTGGPLTVDGLETLARQLHAAG